MTSRRIPPVSPSAFPRPGSPRHPPHQSPISASILRTVSHMAQTSRDSVTFFCIAARGIRINKKLNWISPHNRVAARPCCQAHDYKTAKDVVFYTEYRTQHEASQTHSSLLYLDNIFLHSIHMLYDPYTPIITSPPRTSKMSSSNGPTSAAQTVADEAFEREKAAIVSYEEGWDRWDGPVWPVGYVQCRMREFCPHS